MVQDEQARLLQDALSVLSERQRQLITLLSDSETEGYGAVSTRMGMPQGSIGPTRQRALRQLRVALGKLGLEDCAA